LQDLGPKFYHARWSPHRLSEQEKAERVTLLRDMLEMMNDLGPK
jgi:hypothetical protein